MQRFQDGLAGFDTDEEYYRKKEKLLSTHVERLPQHLRWPPKPTMKKKKKLIIVEEEVAKPKKKKKLIIVEEEVAKPPPKRKKKKYNKEYYDKNRETIVKNAALWRLKNPDGHKEYYNKNREARIKAARAWSLANPEKCKASRQRFEKKHKDTLNKKRREALAAQPRIDCLCGGYYRKSGKSKHYKSKRHQKLYEEVK